MKSAKEDLYEFANAQAYQQQLQWSVANNSRVDKWRKPAESWVKANWDTVMNVQLKKVGLGVIIRDADGEVLACMCSVVDSLQKPNAVETMALKRTGHLCVELGLSKVILDGDSQ
ncbi:uncharacterized protein LOC121249523 [Juglans microcarpa x Juglans regia]|uniref:uncharacterized protein LOC121249523 n=1 Tax=Juglans microcarpa x Juglans regia TaxID=2249226 RepID=UPI001B7DF2AC|nr:uncharacterized protein LOC121249523 [Juglans microcarpa x Juglans regia]